ncbi:hypothetical protein FRB91_010058 [Serendipita sp. 411]|nr:hypothetical protein FRC16_001713 [Serendipita sp. 398]KAG8825782.1 hypothetical protein FRC19_010546 [Serendipita sp. 401]KAG8837004.1 hypothetical protein FRC18_010242 [Serendipita sp. 400]KAG8858306.1 hypothetical protein FRB91_010058 [Serendipita sp. 411]
MSVASKNPFALLNDDEGVSANAAPAETPAADAPKPNRKPSSTRGGRYYQRGGPKPAITSPPPAETEIKSPTGEKKNYNRGDRGDRPPRGDRGDRGGGDRGGGDRGEYRGRGRGRGGGGGRGRGERDPRPDRHSATGITDTAKKIGSGWGNANSEYKDETNAAKDALDGDAWGAPDKTAEGWGAEATNTEGVDVWADPPAAEGEAKEEKPADDDAGKKRRYEDEEDEGKMTLDEYRAKNATSEAVPKLELRKVADGASDLFKGAKQLTKDVDADNYFVGKQPKTQGAPKKLKEGKQYIEIEARFDHPPRGGRGRGRGGRGGREGGREGGGREGGYRNDRGGGGRGQQRQNEVNMEDTNAFPSL